MLFSKFVEYLDELEKNSSRLVMTDVLAKLINDLSVDEIEEGIYLSLGQLGPDYSKLDMGMATKMVLRAVAEMTGQESVKLEEEYKKLGDLGDYVAKETKGVGGKMKVVDVYKILWKIGTESGEGSQERKVNGLVDLLRSLSSLERKYVVRMVLGKVRIGFSAKTIFDALSQVESGSKDLRKQLDNVYQMYPDVGHIAKKIKEEGVIGLSKIKVKTGVPVVSALCQRLNEYGEIVKKMGEVGVERKYDGSRVQIHYKKKQAFLKTFTRNLEESSNMFPELLEMGKWIEADEVILDAEACGYDKSTNKVLPFQVTITRKRKHGVQKASEDVPLRFFVFDILNLNGESLLDETYETRRESLKRIIKRNDVLVVDETIRTNIASEIEKLHTKFLAEGYEGAVVKKWNGFYLPGRQGWNWVKIKEAEGTSGKLSDTLDLVILGYYLGRGKRAGFGMGAFLVGTKKGDKWVSLAKIGTGLTDNEFKGLSDKLSELQLDEKMQNVDVEGSLVPDVWVVPKVVVEIAADEITKSPNHSGGVALRFPRLVKFRDDKGPDQITSWKEILQIGKI